MNFKLAYITIFVAGLMFSGGCQNQKQVRESNVIRWNEATISAKLDIAQQYIDEGKYSLALDTVEKALQFGQPCGRSEFVFGQVLLANGDTSNAKKKIKHALELNPELARAWYTLGGIEFKADKYSKAESYFKEAITIKPSNETYLCAMAVTYDKQGKYLKAIELLQDALIVAPRSVELKIVAAEILAKNQQPDDAISLYRQVLLVKPDDKHIKESLAYCYIRVESWTLAANMLEEVLPQGNSPESERYYDQLANCYMNSGNYAKALHYYDKLSFFRRYDVKTWLDMGQAALGSINPDIAIKCAEKAQELENNNLEAYVLEGCALYMQKKYAEAIDSFVFAAYDQRLGGFSWLMMGRCYELSGNKNFAQKAYDNARGLNPDGKLVTLLTGR